MHPTVIAIVLAVAMAFGLGGGVGSSWAGVDLEDSEKLENRVEVTESRIEKAHRPFGTILNVKKGGDATGEDDSALWTGAYLASQCFKLGAVSSGERSRVRQRIEEVLGSIDRLFKVTGVPGLMARFTFDPRSPLARNFHFKDINTASGAARKAGWRTSSVSGLQDWKWFGATSRDQYSGLFFGLGVCHDALSDGVQSEKALRGRIASRIVNTVVAIKKNGWKIPAGDHDYGSQTLHIVDGDLKLAWGKLARGLTADSALKRDLDAEIEKTLIQYEARRRVEVIQLPGVKLELPIVNNYVEYYGWNLRYMAFYLALQGEPASSRLYRVVSDYLQRMAWEYTHDHKNALFTWIKFATIGKTEEPRDRDALREAQRAIDQLSDLDRTNRRVKNSDRRDIRRDKLAENISWIKQALPFLQRQTRTDLSWLNRVRGDIAADPLEVSERPSVDFYWQHNPFYLDGEGDGSVTYPGVDLVLTYWMGRSFGWIAR